MTAAPGFTPTGLPHVSLGLTLGAIEIGTLLGTILYGTAVVQTYLYIKNYPHDRRWIKAVVGAVCSFETLHTICTWTYLYHLTVTNFGNPFAVNDMPWYVGIMIPLQTFAGSLAQVFFSYRVQVLSGRWWLAAPSYVALLLRATLGVTVFIFTLHDKELTIFRAVHGIIGGMCLVSSAFTDIWNTALLCIYLRNQKSQYTDTQNAMHRIMLWTIETGIVTTVLAVLILALLLAMPANGIWMGLNIIYPKLYPNSLLVSLNSRAALRDGISGVLVTRTYDVEGAQGLSKLDGIPACTRDKEEDSAVRLQGLRSSSIAPFDEYK